MQCHQDGSVHMSANRDTCVFLDYSVVTKKPQPKSFPQLLCDNTHHFCLEPKPCGASGAKGTIQSVIDN